MTGVQEKNDEREREREEMSYSTYDVVCCVRAWNRGKCQKWSSCVQAVGKMFGHLVAPPPHPSHPVSLPDQIIYIYITIFCTPYIMELGQ